MNMNKRLVVLNFKMTFAFIRKRYLKKRREVKVCFPNQKLRVAI